MEKFEVELKWSIAAIAILAVMFVALLAIKPRRKQANAPPEDDAKMLRGVAAQLWDDAHLRLIWVLHNHIGDETAVEGRQQDLAASVQR